jgi:hypothetical protein
LRTIRAADAIGAGPNADHSSLVKKEHAVKPLLIAIALVVGGLSMTAQAADMSCEAKAADKHLAGAAKTSFMKKCEKDTKAAAAKDQCEAQAADKKLHGAAKTSFTKKCVADASK